MHWGHVGDVLTSDGFALLILAYLAGIGIADLLVGVSPTGKAVAVMIGALGIMLWGLDKFPRSI